jgi:hypothetical protein
VQLKFAKNPATIFFMQHYYIKTIFEWEIETVTFCSNAPAGPRSRKLFLRFFHSADSFPSLFAASPIHKPKIKKPNILVKNSTIFWILHRMRLFFKPKPKKEEKT